MIVSMPQEPGPVLMGIVQLAESQGAIHAKTTRGRKQGRSEVVHPAILKHGRAGRATDFGRVSIARGWLGRPGRSKSSQALQRRGLGNPVEMGAGSLASMDIPGSPLYPL
jgi:hypothetical protein